jgi:hypothetical protein
LHQIPLAKGIGLQAVLNIQFSFQNILVSFPSLPFCFVFFSFICVPFPPLLLSGGKDSYVQECGA